MLGSPEPDFIPSPVDVLQPEISDLASTHTVGMEQPDNGVIPAPGGIRAVNCAQDRLCLSIGESLWDGRQFVRTQCGDRLIQRLADMTLLETISKEGSQGRLH